MRSILLMFLGVPIPVILLLAFCTHHFLDPAWKATSNTGTGHRPHFSAEEGHSAISWSAILAGAAAALAASVVLLALAAGFGLKLAAPWPVTGATFDGFNPTLGAILVVIQVLSAALGGYLAGRLRTKWVNVHSHEVHFRDTAHGLLVWAVSTVAGVGLAVTALAPAAGHMRRADGCPGPRAACRGADRTGAGRGHRRPGLAVHGDRPAAQRLHQRRGRRAGRPAPRRDARHLLGHARAHSVRGPAGF